MKRTALALLLISAIFFSSLMGEQVVNAQFLGDVIINPDGAVTGTNRIQRNGNIYTLTGNISGGIQIQKSHIVLDGAGYAVQGNGRGVGIDLSNGRGQDPSRPEVSNVTVKNISILNFYYGVDNANTNSNIFIGNYIENCMSGFWIIGSGNNNIIGNTMVNASITMNYAGITNITGNNFADCWVTAWLATANVDGNYWSDYTTRYPDAKEIGNTGIWDTPYAYWENSVDNHPQTKPIDVSVYDNSEGTHTIYIKPGGSIEGTDKIQQVGNVYTFAGNIYGLITVEKDDVEIDGAGYVLHSVDNEGGIVLENRKGVVLRNIEVVDATFGITIRNGSNIEITESNCRIQLENSSNNTVTGNERISLFFSNSSKNTVTGNKIIGDTLYGFKLQSTSNENSIFENNITDSVGGIEFHGNSSNNSVYENWIVNNADGIIIYNSVNNSIHDNFIGYNKIAGVYLDGASYTTLFRNDFVDNWEWQAISRWSANSWDNGSVGNYWSDYNGTDADGDGVGDEPYLIRIYTLHGDQYDADNYPLMKPIRISESEPFPTVPLLTVIIIAVVAVAAGLLVYHKKRKREVEPT